MTEERKREQAPWYPTIEREPAVNPFVSPQHRSDELDKPIILEDPEAEDDEALVGDRIVRKTDCSTAAKPGIEPTEE
jgi:hypothetical protein